MTDLGHVFTGPDNVVASLYAVLLESNYGPWKRIARFWATGCLCPLQVGTRSVEID